MSKDVSRDPPLDIDARIMRRVRRERTRACALGEDTHTRARPNSGNTVITQVHTFVTLYTVVLSPDHILFRIKRDSLLPPQPLFHVGWPHTPTYHVSVFDLTPSCTRTLSSAARHLLRTSLIHIL